MISYNSMLLSIFVLALSFTACNQVDKNTDKPLNTELSANKNEVSSELDYKIAKGYFIKNTVSEADLKTTKVSTKEAFDKLFGAATVMGADGKPTEIDFDKQFVITVMGAETNKPTTFKPISLVKNNQKIVASIAKIEAAEASYTMRPLLLLLVDKKDEASVEIQFMLSK